MGIKQKSDRDQERSRIAAGGWEVAYGDLVNEFDILTAAFAGIASAATAGGSVAAWVQQQIQAQIVKFGKSLNDISPTLRQQAISKVEEIVKNGLKGEWNIGGIGVKAGLATYHRWWKIPPFGGWNKLPPPHFQPYIAFRIAQLPADRGDSAGTVEVIKVPSLADIGPTEAPFEPPPSPIGTYEDISLALTDEEVSKILKEAGQQPLPPALHA